MHAKVLAVQPALFRFCEVARRREARNRSRLPADCYSLFGFFPLQSQTAPEGGVSAWRRGDTRIEHFDPRHGRAIFRAFARGPGASPRRPFRRLVFLLM